MKVTDERFQHEDGSIHDVVAEALEYTKKANELRDSAIRQLLAQREQIERDLKSLGHNGELNGNGTKPPPEEKPGEDAATPTPKHQRARFKDMSLGEVGRVLLQEHEVLHGKKIEELAKAGGFRSASSHFQNYMPVAFKRAGGFENIGGNRWRLNADITPQR